MKYKTYIIISSILVLFIFVEFRIVQAQRTAGTIDSGANKSSDSSEAKAPTYGPIITSSVDEWNKIENRLGCKERCYVKIDIAPWWLATQFPRQIDENCHGAYFPNLEEPDFVINVEDGDGVELQYRSTAKSVVMVETVDRETEVHLEYNCADSFDDDESYAYLELEHSTEFRSRRHYIWIGSRQEEQRKSGNLFIDTLDNEHGIDWQGEQTFTHMDMSPAPVNRGVIPVIAANQSENTFFEPSVEGIRVESREKGIVLKVQVMYPSFNTYQDNEHEKNRLTHLDIHAIPLTLHGRNIINPNSVYTDSEGNIANCSRIVPNAPTLEKITNCGDNVSIKPDTAHHSNENQSEVHLFLPYNAFPSEEHKIQIEVVLKDSNNEDLGRRTSIYKDSATNSKLVVPNIEERSIEENTANIIFAPIIANKSQLTGVTVPNFYSQLFIEDSDGGFSSLVWIQPNVTVTILREETNFRDGPWYRVEYRNRIGLIHSKYLLLD